MGNSVAKPSIFLRSQTDLRPCDLEEWVLSRVLKPALTTANYSAIVFLWQSTASSLSGPLHLRLLHPMRRSRPECSIQNSEHPPTEVLRSAPDRAQQSASHSHRWGYWPDGSKRKHRGGQNRGGRSHRLVRPHCSTLSGWTPLFVDIHSPAGTSFVVDAQHPAAAYPA
eukprot:532917-Amphidinium_carterae.1